MKQESPPTHLDVKAFAQSAGQLNGRDLLGHYERLLHEAHGSAPQSELCWSARGELRANQAGAEQVWLHLTVDVSLPLICQRCLHPLQTPVHVKQSFRFVASEAAAEEEDEEAQEDVLALSAEFSLADLIEDEVLMALPLVPRHEECPVALKLAAADVNFEAASAEKSNPFAVLAKFQAGKSD